MHSQVELGIIPLYCLNEPFNDDASFEFFLDLTNKGILWGFAWFHLTTREFPAIFEITISSLGGEDTAVIIVYNCSYNFYLHRIDIY